MEQPKGAAMELGTERIRKLLVQYAVPAIIAMTASSLYNMIDSIFIGHGVGPMAISGLALTFPLMNLAAAFGSLVGVGAATLVSMRLGQRDYLTAQKVLGNVVTLNLIIGVAFGGLTLAFLDPILYFFGASDATVGYARDYMRIILLGNVVTHMYLGLNSVLRAAGHPRKSMYATINTVVINALLDPLFIYGFGWGIEGAAIATVLAQIVSLVWQFRILSDRSELLHLRRGIYRPEGKIVRNILAIGMSPFLMNLAACFIVILINKGLKEYGGDLNIGAYGIVNRLAFFFVMVVMGLNQGMQPIAGYNFGARQFARVDRVLKLTIVGATGVMTLGFLVGEFAPRLAVSAFTKDPELIRLASEGMRIVFCCFPIIGFQMVTTNFFQSIGMAGKAIFLSLSRQLLFLM
ncbi:MAG: MATE family efflux transporter, partial [Alistipes sp.]|nr:MATE family efflux transporter [Alistipes sp.]